MERGVPPDRSVGIGQDVTTRRSLRQGTPEEHKAVAEGVLVFYGTYSIGLVTHDAASEQSQTTAPIVTSFHVIRERSTLIDGYLRARLELADGSQLEFSEYMQRPHW